MWTEILVISLICLVFIIITIETCYHLTTNAITRYIKDNHFEKIKEVLFQYLDAAMKKNINENTNQIFNDHCYGSEGIFNAEDYHSLFFLFKKLRGALGEDPEGTFIDGLVNKMTNPENFKVLKKDLKQTSLLELLKKFHQALDKTRHEQDSLWRQISKKFSLKSPSQQMVDDLSD